MEALTPQQLASFDAFGFLLLPCYSPDEVDTLRGEASRLSAGWGTGGSAEGLAPFEAREHLVERSATLTELLVKKVLGDVAEVTAKKVPGAPDSMQRLEEAAALCEQGHRLFTENLVQP
eukprot:COSAG04_NODE_11292_length_718_cov_0.888530_1_plen_118_part_10